MISDEQARFAAESLRDSASARSDRSASEVSPDLMARVMSTLAEEPECREERLTAAKLHLQMGEPSAQEIASKMVARLVSDSLR